MDKFLYKIYTLIFLMLFIIACVDSVNTEKNGLAILFGFIAIVLLGVLLVLLDGEEDDRT